MEKEKDPRSRISFQPISEGLGFHPFSDGLPYAPLTKTQKPSSRSLAQGEGAVAAGPPKMVFPKPIPKASIPVAKLSVAAPLIPSASTEKIIHAFGFGYVIKRLTAFSLDFLINSSLLLAALEAFIEKQNLELFSNREFFAAFLTFLAVSNWILILTQEILFQQSAGKKLVRLKLEGRGFLIFLRGLLFPLSVGFFGLGVLLSLFDKKKRCWHDRVVSIQPLEV